MRWEPATIAGFAQAAGFTAPELPTAVAVALAGSGGDDAFRWHGGTPGARDERGLWQLDASGLDPAQADLLYDPRRNAGAARALYVAAGESWEWHPVYQAGLWRQSLQAATEGALRASQTQRAKRATEEPLIIPARRGAQLAAQHALAQLAGLSRVLRRGGR